MGCGCGAAGKEFLVTYADGTTRKFPTETEAQFALKRAGQGGTITPVAKS